MSLRNEGGISIVLIRQAKTKKIVIVRLDRTIQNLLKRLDFPIKSANEKLFLSQSSLVLLNAPPDDIRIAGDV